MTLLYFVVTQQLALCEEACPRDIPLFGKSKRKRNYVLHHNMFLQKALHEYIFSWAASALDGGFVVLEVLQIL